MVKVLMDFYHHHVLQIAKLEQFQISIPNQGWS